MGLKDVQPVEGQCIVYEDTSEKFGIKSRDGAFGTSQNNVFYHWSPASLSQTYLLHQNIDHSPN